MIFLIISLVAGLVYLISGKVKWKKTVYLEGTKARIAGLIFLAPVGLILAILGTAIILSLFGITISDSSSEIVDAFSSTLVLDGFMIGLAYIHFYSVSRELKDRSGCLTYWIVLAAAIASLGLSYFFLPNIRSSSNWFASVILGIYIFQIVSIIGIWSWKKWGVFGYVVVTFIAPVTAFINTNSIWQVFLSLIQSSSLILVLYLLVRPKWQFFE